MSASLTARLTLAALVFTAIAFPRASADETPGATASGYRVEEKSIAQLRADLARGAVTAEELVRAYEARIAALDVRGPALHSVIAINPDALGDARRADADRRAGKAAGALAGIPILIKDNIETDDPNPTTAGSLALARNVTHRDAGVVRRLKAAGAIVLGKTNLSEWANVRSSASISGWSAVGGLVKNPYALDRGACGSSSGTATAVAASLAAAGVGTETDGSVVCPSSFDGLVGLKPTVGLVSRSHVIPISHSQDTPGPIGRSIADVATLLGAMAGSDPADVATKRADVHVADYAGAIRAGTLRGKRFGVLRYATGSFPPVDALFDASLAAMRANGATIVELKAFKPKRIGDAEATVLSTEFKADVDAYLATTPSAVTSRTLAALIAFDRNEPRELALFGQDGFEQAQATKGLRDPAYLRARATSLRGASTDGIDALIARYRLDALVAPSDGPAGRIDVVTGDHGVGGSADELPAVAGYPHLTVPMGDVRGLPVGISFIGKAWSEAPLLAIGAAYERATGHRRVPHYRPSVETGPAMRRLLDPPG